MPNHVNTSSLAPARAAQLSDRELIKALRDQVQPAAGDPVDVLAVRGDAGHVARFADHVSTIGAEAAEVQREQAAVADTLRQIEDLLTPAYSEERGQLTSEETEQLSRAVAAIEPRSGAAASDVEGDAEPTNAARLEAAESRLINAEKALEARAATVSEQASKLTPEGDGLVEAVARIAEETARQISSESARALQAQSQRIVPGGIAALGGGDR